METATRVLRNEHNALSKCLSFTESVAAQIRRGEVVQAEVLGQAVECFRVFMDGCLLAKEENFLFQMLERKGMSRRSGPLGLMLTQHATGRKLLKQMAGTAAEGEAGISGARNRWATAALDFVNLMRDHIKEEEEFLFMMADNFLQPGENSELAAEFERFETAQSASGVHRRVHKMPEGLPEAEGSRQSAR